MTYEVECSYCKKKFLCNACTKSRFKKGKHVFCSIECKLNFHGQKLRALNSCCLCCGKELTKKQIKAGNRFCSHACAASTNNLKRKELAYNFTKQQKSLIITNIISNNINSNYTREFLFSLNDEDFNKILLEYEKFKKNKVKIRKAQRVDTRVCCVCGKSFNTIKSSSRKTCSDICRKVLLSEAGRRAAQTNKNIRRSKNEILFANLCKKYFNNILTNEAMFNGWDADVIISNLKIAILWNGKWHYEKILENCSLEQIQARDKIKINEIKKAGYIPYIIKDVGKFNPVFVNEQFNIFLNNINNKLSEGGEV